MDVALIAPGAHLSTFHSGVGLFLEQKDHWQPESTLETKVLQTFERIKFTVRNLGSLHASSAKNFEI